ncbi:MAG: thioredoxin family protein [Candidatus Cloacimonetes bacterium]|nr:thioredoxin family protein [Candidatus Cloacimonadota bacterium]
MPILDDKVISEVKKILGSMVKPVTLKLFTQPFECGFCKETHNLLDELVTASEKLSLEVQQFDQDKDEVQKYGIDKIPAIAILGEKDYGIRFYGIPSGYEFSSFLNAILMVSTGIVKLTEDTKAFLNKLQNPVHIQVFVTPTCPYCPPAVMLAHRLAYYSD